MSEKLSEKHLRAQKVAALKERLQEEVHEALFQGFVDLDIVRCQSSCLDDAKPYVERLHKLIVLEDYLKDNALFMRFEMADRSRDVIVYKVHSETLDWMLQNKYLLSDILSCIERIGAPAEAVLSEDFFEFDVFGVMERALWEARQEKPLEQKLSEAVERSADSCQKIKDDKEPERLF